MPQNPVLVKVEAFRSLNHGRRRRRLLIRVAVGLLLLPPPPPQPSVAPAIPAPSSSSRKPLRSSPHLLTFILFLTRNGGARVDKALSASYCLMVCGGHPVGLVGIPASAHRMAHRTSCSNCNVWETICNRFQLWPLQRDNFKPNAFLFTIDAEIEHG